MREDKYDLNQSIVFEWRPNFLSFFEDNIVIY